MNRVLTIIVIAQFLCTSVWFAGNSIVSDLAQAHGLDPDFLAHLTSAIQIGFITGTLVFAVFTIADRFAPSRVFFVSAILCSLANLGLMLPESGATEILLSRFLTGFFLAGVYPVGMKIVADYFEAGLGKSLGFLVGALVLGTAFPHFLKSVNGHFHWSAVVYATSLFSLIGGLSVFLLVPSGPYRKMGQKPSLTAFFQGFKRPEFRSVAFGYFGHMWELYTFWAFVPVMLTTYNRYQPHANLNVSLWSFLIIAIGALSCGVIGILSQYFGEKKLATLSLLLSGLCCLFSPLILQGNSVFLLLTFLFFWGFFVISDSPLFSTLVAKNAPAESRGASLTIVNCIGFAITIISIQFLREIAGKLAPHYSYMFLSIGPILGLIALLTRRSEVRH